MSLFIRLPEDLQREIGNYFSEDDFDKVPFCCLHKENDIFWKVKVVGTLGETFTYRNMYRFISGPKINQQCDWENLQIENLTDKIFCKLFINRFDRHGKTMLTANYYYNLEFLKALIDNGADINLPDLQGHTLLSLGVSYSYKKIVKLAIEAGANVNYYYPWGETALHLAAVANNFKISIIRLLLEAGANPSIKDNNGRTFVDIIEYSTLPNNKVEIPNLLKEFNFHF